jgi:hypothetical protein
VSASLLGDLRLTALADEDLRKFLLMAITETEGFGYVRFTGLDDQLTVYNSFV